MRKNVNRFMINLGLLIFGIAAAFSGWLIQIKYHMGNHGNIDINQDVMGINYEEWSLIHKISIVALSILIICHVYLHWKWYKGVITKRLFSKNQQVLILSFIFAIVAITGLTPWFIDLMKGNQMLRKIFIEIHDKLTILFTIYLILHIIRRLRWFSTTLSKIKNETQRTINSRTP